MKLLIIKLKIFREQGFPVVKVSSYQKYLIIPRENL